METKIYTHEDLLNASNEAFHAALVSAVQVFERLRLTGEEINYQEFKKKVIEKEFKCRPGTTYCDMPQEDRSKIINDIKNVYNL